MTIEAPEPGSILLVDDRPENLLALEGVLDPLGHRLVSVGGGDEALRALLREPFDLIVLDVQMPGIDGFETARHIRGRARTAAIPIVFLTAISREQEHHLRGYDVGAVDYVAKPFDPDVLRAKVKILVERSQLRRTVEAQAAALADQVGELARRESALAAAAHELARSNAELERFAGAAARALRDPLLTATGLLELAPALGGDEVDRARRQIRRALDVVDGLTRFATVASSPVGNDAVAVDLAGVLDEVLASRRSFLESIAAEVRCDPLPVVRGERWQLVDVVGELVDNAVANRSTEHALRLHVSVSKRGGNWVLTLRDNGVGIDADRLPRLFTMLAESSGVGLATAQRIIERHGGEIWAESGVDRGTAISFSLPAG